MEVFARLLHETIGLDHESIGLSAVERAVRVRMAACKTPDPERYLQCLRGTRGEMQALVEAVGREYWPAYFGKLAALLKPGGRACVQSILMEESLWPRYIDGTDFIQQYIFPGGCLPSVGALTDAAARHELSLTRRDEIGPHYAETPRRWRANLGRARDDLAGLGYDERFVRLWDFYFSYCEAGFEERAIGDVHLVYAAPGRADAMRHRGTAADSVARHGVVA
jgi:hypothetical protein